jgi:F0F1-type ATP synthase assembly protein I
MPDEQPRRAPIVERAKWFQMTEAASVGIEIAAAVGVGALGGLWLQNNVTHWAPWTLYIGLSIGLGAAVLAIIRTARNFTRVIEAEEAAEREKAAQAHESHEPTDEPPDASSTPAGRSSSTSRDEGPPP